MRPARGSQRVSTRAPQRHAASRITEPRAETSPQCLSETNTVMTEQNQKKARKPLTRSTLQALEKMLDVSILSVLTEKTTEQSQQHLDRLKNHFLAECAQLAVPPSKCGNMMQAFHQAKAEKEKRALGKKTLQNIEASMQSVVSSLDVMEVQMNRLEKECSIMKSKLEEEEKKADEVLQLSEQSVLCLPAYPTSNQHWNS